jgi:copper resistance protein B
MDRNTRKRKMNMTLNALSLALAFAGMSALPAVAQTMGATSTMDHSMMDHGSMQAPPTESPAEAMPGMKSAVKPAKQGSMDTNMPGMDHGSSTQAQGGTVPAEARDPHAYSDGYTLDSGLYALPGTRQLRLADEHNFGSVLFNRLERGFGDTSSSTAYDTQAWFGRDYDRLVIKVEGDVARGKLQEARTEVLWGHAIAPFWDAQLGLRNDSGGTAPERTWLALGVQGLAPYWFGVDAAAYVGDNGRTALRLSGEYEILLTQKLILQPRVELNFYGQDDVAREIGSGLANGVAGLRLRYEINRQFAPYLGVERSNKFGNTADLVRASGGATGDTRWVAGVRFWF